MASSWMKDFQDRVKRASNDVNTALQPRVAHAKRSFELSIQQIGLKPGREIYQDDESLLVSLTDLDHLRLTIQSLASSVEQQRSRLLENAKAQKQVAAILSSPAEPVLTILRKQLPPSHLEAQLALGASQQTSAAALSRFALDMSTPMADLSRTFEEAYSAKILPLKKRYINQKVNYLRTLHQAEAAVDDPQRRQAFLDSANATAPTWRATSDSLMAEIQSLISYTVSNLSEWSLNVAQAEAETYARLARTYEDPAKQAEKAQNEPRS